MNQKSIIDNTKKKIDPHSIKENVSHIITELMNKRKWANAIYWLFCCIRNFLFPNGLFPKWVFLAQHSMNKITQPLIQHFSRDENKSSEICEFGKLSALIVAWSLPFSTNERCHSKTLLNVSYTSYCLHLFWFSSARRFSFCTKNIAKSTKIMTISRHCWIF